MKFRNSIVLVVASTLLLACHSAPTSESDSKGEDPLVNPAKTVSSVSKSAGESTPNADETFTPTPSSKEDSSKESEETSSTTNGNVEEDIYVIFFNGSDSDVATNPTKPISKREVSGNSSQPKDENNQDNPTSEATTTLEKGESNSTSKEVSSETNTDIILIPFQRPRPILIDIIFFKVNRTDFNQTGPSSPSLFSGKGVEHLNPINSDEETLASVGSTRKSSLEETSTTTKLPGHAHSRRRRETIFSHHTNNSQAASSSEETDLSTTINPSSMDDANNNLSVNSVSTIKTLTPQETNKAGSSNSNNPLAPTVSNGSRMSTSSLENDKKLKDDDSEGSGTTVTPTSTSTENAVILIFKEIIEFGGNVTNALFGGKVDTNNANSNSGNGFESSGTNDPNDNSGISSPTGSTFSPIHGKTSIPSDTLSSSNQNSTSHNQPPQNGLNLSMQ